MKNVKQRIKEIAFHLTGAAIFGAVFIGFWYGLGWLMFIIGIA